MIPKKAGMSTRGAIAVIVMATLAGCHVQWVSPYSADLQKKATDMLADVVAWDSHMRDVAGTAAADPRNPDVQAKLEAWRGDIAAMTAIELGIDPDAANCDALLGAMGGRIAGTVKAVVPKAPGVANSAATLGHCESLPGIFANMTKQVAASTTDGDGIPVSLDQQCKLPWLPDDYFAALKETRATSGASSPARPASASAKAGVPTDDQKALAVKRCRALFVPESGVVHGNLVDSLVTDLDAIVYREGREAPPSAK
jgi:hypothetical protein